MKGESAFGDLVNMMTGINDKKWEERIKKRDDEWESRAKGLLDEYSKTTDAKIAKAVSESEARQHKAVEDLRQEILAKLDTNSSSAGPASTSTSARAAPGSSDRHFIPKKLWIKGYVVDWTCKDRSSLSKPKVIEWINSIKNELKDELKDHIDVEASTRFANKGLFTKFAILLKNVDTRDGAWKVKDDIVRILSEGKCFINDIEPRAVLEPSPVMKPLIDQGGKALGLLERKGVAKGSMLPEWGPPVRIFDNRNPDSPICICEYDASQGWTVHGEAFQVLLPDDNPEDFKAALQ